MNHILIKINLFFLVILKLKLLSSAQSLVSSLKLFHFSFNRKSKHICMIVI